MTGSIEMKSIQFLCTIHHIHMTCITIISSIMLNFFIIIKYRNFSQHFVRDTFEIMENWHAFC